ncbi:hypothetical protein [Actinoallomurus sp. CA-142502]|uniref:hypothetical protein n=1 Tax=Actinoallomurus sp. CA-142502 TaxID=3239885 RepID=UPI003D8A7DE5
MLGQLGKDTFGLLDRRFVMNAFLPALILVGSVAILAMVWWNGAATSSRTWDRLTPTAKGLVITGVVLLAGVLANVVAAHTSTLISWYEGHWRSPIGLRVAKAGRRWHRRRLERLDPADPADYERIHHTYPLPSRPDDVQATRLGNILRNAELYPYDRYGIDAAIVWPRLHPLLPPELTAPLSAAKADLEFQLVVSTLSAVFSVIAGVLALAAGESPGVFLACYWGGGLLAWAAYVGALRSARLYGMRVKVAFDLYRGALLDRLDPSEPDRGEERWRRLALWWYRGLPPDADLLDEDLPASPAAGTTTARRRLRLPAIPLTGWIALAALCTGLLALTFLP